MHCTNGKSWTSSSDCMTQTDSIALGAPAHPHKMAQNLSLNLFTWRINKNIKAQNAIVLNKRMGEPDNCCEASQKEKSASMFYSSPRLVKSKLYKELHSSHNALFSFLFSLQWTQRACLSSTDILDIHGWMKIWDRKTFHVPRFLLQSDKQYQINNIHKNICASVLYRVVL